MRWGEDAGSSTVISFIVATSIFAVAFGSVTYFASDLIASDPAAGEPLDAVAAAALQVLDSQPGSPSHWEDDASDPNSVVDRLGLLQIGSRTTMDGDKIAALSGWTGSTTRYNEAREALGLEEYEMRIRSFPTFTTTSSGVTGLATQDVAYIRPSDPVKDGQVTTPETTAISQTGSSFSNAHADTDLANGYAVGDVFPDVHATLNSHLAPRLHGFLGAHDATQVTAPQTYWKVVELPSYGGPDLALDTDAAVPATRVLTVSTNNAGSWDYGSSRSALQLANPLDRILLAEVDRTGAVGAEAVTLDLVHWLDGYTSVPLSNSVTDDYGRIEFLCVSGPSCPGVPAWHALPMRVNEAGSKSDFAETSFDLTGLVAEGDRGYVALTWYSYDDGDPTHRGAGWFIRSATVTTVANGVTTVWDNDLDFEESRYDALVVGSQVAQANLDLPADPVFDQALKAWVKAGGDLVVTGSDTAAATWLDRLASGVETQSALGLGLYEDASDTSHAALNNPYRLRWSSYPTASQTYKPPVVAVAGTEPLAHVVHHKGQVAGVDESLLSVSSGAWKSDYEGVALITAYQPFAMGAVEAMHFYANALVYAHYNDLEVDFGAQVPAGADIGTAQRSVVIDARSVDLGWLEGQMVVHVW